MCGIAGIIKKSDINLEKHIGYMNKSMQKRGPDGNGIYVSKFLGLGHTRLAIQDVSDNANQPMIDTETNIVISYNGEIYNFKELRDELINHGQIFKSSGDTEVLLKGYLVWGEKVFEKCIGMWAVAIWNPNKNELILSRDRFGIKPLYISRDKEGNIIFGSTISSILSTKLLSVEINKKITKDYLIYGLVDQNDETFYEGIFKFPKATNGVISLSKDLLSIEYNKYWQIEDSINENNISLKDESNIFYENFMNSLKIHSRSDVEISSCLSGGMDSSSIVSGLTKIGPNSSMIKTFSATFPGKPYDEDKYSSALAEEYALNRYTVSPTTEDFLKDIDKVLVAQEEPFASTGIYVQWKVFEKIKSENIKVAIDGQGADEYLAGYLSFLVPFMFHCLKHLQINYFYNSFKSFINNKIYKKLTGNIIATIFRVFGFKSIFSSRYESILNKSYFENYCKSNFLPMNNSKENKINGFKSVLIRYIQTASLPSLLRYEDRNSMYFSIESRVPFLDHRLVEQALSTNTFNLLDGKYTKKILRCAFEDHVPNIITSRTDKIGFGNPETEWVKALILKGELTKLLDDNEINDFLNTVKVKKILSTLKTSSDYSFAWRLYCFMKWRKEFSI